MTNEEAIKMLKQWNEGLLPYEDEKEGIECHNIAISALEKQIPEPPYLETPIGAYDWYFCPNCNHNDVEYKDKYCRRCGQALDWRK